MPVERTHGSTSLIDVLDRVLDKGIVIDAWIRQALVGIDVVTAEARIIVASRDTFLTHSGKMGAPRPVRTASATFGSVASSRSALPRDEDGDDVTELCAYAPCKCRVPNGEIFCSDICAMFGAKLVDKVAVSSAVPLKPDSQVVPKCACGHEGCGDSLVSREVH